MPYENAIIHALRAVLGLSVLFLAGFTLGGVLLGYADSLQVLADWAGQGDKVDKIAVFLSPSSFRVFLFIAFILSLLAGWLLLQLPRFLPLLSRGLASLRSSLRSLLRGIDGSGLPYVLLFPLLASVWFALRVPVNYDEAYTFLHFTEKSPIASLCYYPVPNNHVLHSLITNATRHLPFSDPLTRLRASSIVINMMIWVLAFRFVQRWWDTRTALAAVAIGSVLFMAVYYSFMSRGYALVCLAFIGALYAVSAHIHEGSQRHLLWFAVFSIIGFFTMPSFLYPWLSLNAWWCWQSRTSWQPKFVTNLIIVISVGLLYLPIVLVSGLSSLTSNPFVKPIGRMQVFASLGPFFRQVLAELTGLPPVLVLLWLVVGVFFAFRRMPTVWWSFFIIMLVSAPLLLLLHSVIPFPRTFVYYGWVITLLLVLPWSALLTRMPRGIFLPILLIIQACFLYNFHHRIAAYESYNTTFHDINQQIVGPHTYYVNSRIFDTSLHFALRQMGFSESLRQSIYPPVPVSADSIRGYDYIIIDKEFDRTVHRKPMLTDAYVNLYNEE
jgi:hypothetical protein